MEKFYDLHTDFGDYKVKVERARYLFGNGWGVFLVTDSGEPFADITVCLGTPMERDNFAYIDTNNCAWVEKFIKDNGLGEPTGTTGISGFCDYPLYELNFDKIPLVE